MTQAVNAGPALVDPLTLKSSSNIAEELPSFRGSLRRGVPLGPLTWMRVGGPASVVANPADDADLTLLLHELGPEVPVMPLGVGSNLLVRDGGLDAVIVRLGGVMAQVIIDDHVVIVGAGALDQRTAQVASRAGLSGLEFMNGIPGTIGGAIRMNAGCFGSETAERLLWVEAMDRSGKVHRVKPAELGFSYRHSELPADWIVLRACFDLVAGDQGRITQRMNEIRTAREATQPQRVATGGSTFKNPPKTGPDGNNPEGRRAWELIDKAGCRGLRRGKAMVSDKHCNFLVNTGAASSAEMEALGKEVRAKVFATSGILLAWEIVRVGTELPALQGLIDEGVPA
ncbi:UDP-N-acetylmuramate dehydrogenase [Arboricoccus pini]|uniref:UDP-N-acetylenolpyruvoylglucosamine reductase n=1 Tax=Arboricoccus pini TaxID=1963835 RepID=A0A212QAC4_9PROT|nr:UDP-N-acetylmuramate dehydrogenase [Arboricoccus pini]SNB56321.1 UDP-N-acetylmuramate dehydrogenase [Arboricoccus pini]